MSLPPFDDQDPQRLDADHVLEPMEAEPRLPSLGGDPIVRDVRGRIWRVRRRPAWTELTDVPVALLGLAALILLALVVVLLLV